MSVIDKAPVPFPGARPPDRQRSVESQGIRLAVYEWGAADAPPVLLAHGGFDFARTFDVFAPLIADAGFRVVSWDQRGHGNSEHAELYSWDADERDLLAVANSVSPGPFPAIGHSKGGSLLAHIIQALPHRFSRYVSVDGLPFRVNPPDVANREQTAKLRTEVVKWLDERRRAHGMARRPGTPEELAARRSKMNPRLSREWLEYIVYAGAREAEDGWRWKLDPSLRMGGFGPWRSRWVTDRLPGFPIPMLAMFGTEREPLDWGVNPEEISRYLPRTARTEVFKGVGHFIHIEQPRQTAELVLEFLKNE
ncbi:alpha/beta fold hydrolase [Gilvimarinus sp. F26214L]|uniref:alpha/beta fold hydrolase n=1 Tax=Gilvimarinus sp. DZF01 TaxID=3461371 RepID=UPI0040464B16